MAQSPESVGVEPEKKKGVLEYRRCALLSIIGSTPATNPQLKSILSPFDLLVHVKSWLEEILNDTIGGLDLLLHLLSMITALPVTKTVVVSSGLGKAVGAVAKHKICVGTPNESAIKTRVQEVKDAWNASVKANKEANGKATKRALDSSAADSTTVKKSRTEEPTKKSSSLSSLLGKVSGSKPSKAAKLNTTSNGSSNASVVSQESETKKAAAPKKSSQRVKWADHFGGTLEASRVIQGDSIESTEQTDEKDSGVSWTDRKKRDRLREKELMTQAKKSKLIDDDDDDFYMAAAVRMKAAVSWHEPALLPARSDVSEVQCDSKEVAVQKDRVVSVAAVQYLKDENVPGNPTQMSDVEQALGMAAEASKVVGVIPFFVAQQPAPAPAVAPAPAYSLPVSGSIPPPPPPSYTAPPPAAPTPQAGATAEMVQSMGLPLFLVGSNVQALQTLAATPSLLSTFVDAYGMYDQTRLMSLVQTLSQSMAPSQLVHQQVATSAYQPPRATSYQAPGSYGAAPMSAYQPPQPSAYGTSTTSTSPYGPAATAPATTGFRGKSDAGNLHVSGYGPTTTQTDIITLFSPYVRVDEVVMKGTFSFVNTSDPDAAQRAKDALQGAMLGGAPIRINPATRRSRDGAPPAGNPYAPAATSTPYASATPYAPPAATIPNAAVPLPRDPVGQIDYNNVRDDRGNPATKNLFVAGYGSGTTEQMLRETFGQHASITGVIMKGSFSFVNTSDKVAAVHAREALMGAVLNGGVLRINFAKETGRLGTSFDTTYGGSQSSQSHYMRNSVH